MIDKTGLFRAYTQTSCFLLRSQFIAAHRNDSATVPQAGLCCACPCRRYDSDASGGPGGGGPGDHTAMVWPVVATTIMFTWLVVITLNVYGASSFIARMRLLPPGPSLFRLRSAPGHGLQIEKTRAALFKQADAIRQGHLERFARIHDYQRDDYTTPRYEVVRPRLPSWHPILSCMLARGIMMAPSSCQQHQYSAAAATMLLIHAEAARCGVQFVPRAGQTTFRREKMDFWTMGGDLARRLERIAAMDAAEILRGGNSTHSLQGNRHTVFMCLPRRLGAPAHWA